jgi:hypothetical protein
VAAVSSFTAVADEWLRKVEKEGRSAVTLMKLRWLLGFFKTAIGKRPVAAISAHELLMMLRKMEAKGCYETVDRRAKGALTHFPCSDHRYAAIRRALSKSRLARPYIWRLTSFSRVT